MKIHKNISKGLYYFLSTYGYYKTISTQTLIKTLGTREFGGLAFQSQKSMCIRQWKTSPLSFPRIPGNSQILKERNV